MIRIFELEEAEETILERKDWDRWEIPERLQDGIERLFGERLSPSQAVERILDDVRSRGDEALLEWTSRLDGVSLDSVEVPWEEISRAYDLVPDDLVDALELAAERIEEFHSRQPKGGWIDFERDGALGQLVRPLSSVGIYVPGGTAPLPSTVLMTAIPARVAGVEFVSIATPPKRPDGSVDPAILVAADIADVDVVYRIGGAQAIGAMAFGTESVRRVDKIVGPGNIFVTLAKKQVYGIVGIDGLPGPTETVVIADEHAEPELVAADLLAQAEHDVLATAILLTPSRKLAEAVQEEVEVQLLELSRREIVEASLAGRGGIVLVTDLQEAVQVANDFAPEHLCLLVQNPWEWLGEIRNAGGVFLGESSFEVLGDYVAGPSHTMPTGGTARFASPLNVLDFVKIISVVGLNRRALEEVVPPAVRIAEAEGLTAHANAARKRERMIEPELS